MDIDRLISIAWNRIEQGNIDGAIDSLRQALSFDPDIAEAHAYLSLCLLNKKRLHAALNEAKMALVLNSELEIAIYALANTYIGQRKFKEAKIHINHLIDMNPNNSRYYLLNANLHQNLRKFDKILPMLEKALELEPESPDILSELSDYFLRKGDVVKAEKYAIESLQCQPENVAGLVSMGNVLIRRGQLNDARDHAIWALRQDPENNGALVLLAGIKARSNPLLGVWWRYSVWLSSMGSTRSILILLFAYVVYRIVTMASQDLGHQNIASIINYLWLAIVIYTFVGPTIFKNSVNKELESVSLSRDY